MGFWGKIIGGAIGFALAGPLGALAGAALGHGWDSRETIDTGRTSGIGTQCPHCGARVTLPGAGTWRCPVCHKTIQSGMSHQRGSTEREKQYTFFVATFASLGKVAGADGTITPEEIKLFEDHARKILKLDPETIQFARRIFNEASRSGTAYDDYLEQFYGEFKQERNLLLTLLEIQVAMAYADGKLHPKEEEYLLRSQRIFKITADELNRLKERYAVKGEAAYSVLGCSPDASNEEVRRCYKKLAMENHPDRVKAQGLPPEFEEFAHNKFLQIQSAWEEIKKKRGL